MCFLELHLYYYSVSITGFNNNRRLIKETRLRTEITVLLHLNCGKTIICLYSSYKNTFEFIVYNNKIQEETWALCAINNTEGYWLKVVYKTNAARLFDTASVGFCYEMFQKVVFSWRFFIRWLKVWCFLESVDSRILTIFYWRQNSAFKIIFLSTAVRIYIIN